MMGQQVSRVYRTLLKRPAQRFNVEHRFSINTSPNKMFVN